MSLRWKSHNKAHNLQRQQMYGWGVEDLEKADERMADRIAALEKKRAENLVELESHRQTLADLQEEALTFTDEEVKA